MSIVQTTASLDEAAAVDEMIAIAEGLLPAIRATARASELNRAVVPEIIAQAAEAGLFEMLVPKVYGGRGLGARALCEVSRVLARADASTAWTLGFLLEHNWMICRFPLEGQQELYSNATYVLASAPLQPTGSGERVEGGFEITGTWRYASANGNGSAGHNRAVPSHETVSTIFPSAVNAAVLTASSWPRRVRNSLPLARSQTRAVRSSDAVTSQWPSRLNEASKMARSCP